MTERIRIWTGGTHFAYGWYSPNANSIFLTNRVDETNIEYIINHETIHMVLNNFINYDTTTKFDNVDLVVWLMENDMFVSKKRGRLKRLIRWLKNLI